MIKKLRIKFVAAAMLSLFAVLFVIVGVINVFNYQNIVSEADSTLAILKMNDGKFPIRDTKPFGQRFDDDKFMSPELPYQSRFFSVLINHSGEAVSVDTAHIAAVDYQTAVQYAQRAAAHKGQKGFLKNYRYLVSSMSDGKRVIFLDCSRDLSTFRTFLFTSVGISAMGMATVFVLILFLSARIVRPFSESYEKQKRFITDAGHEIKTPITIIDADAEVLEMEIGENEWVSDIRSQAKRLSQLTNDLIYLSRMQEEQTKLQIIDFSVSDVVSETVASFNAPAVTAKKQLTADIEPMLSYRGDEKAIRHLVSILLDNAIKYSDQNTPIYISLVKAGKGINLSVYNTSSCLKKENLPHLFDRFYRADQSRNSKTGGYGIGLSVAKAIVEAHKGKISAWSPAPSVVCVTAVLPL